MAESVTRINIRTNTLQRSTMQFVRIDGVILGLKSRWTAYDGLWRLWITDSASTMLVGPITLVGGMDLLLGHKHIPGIPQGTLFVYSQDREPPDRDTLDVTAMLVYRGVS